MRHTTVLTISSVLTVLLATIHITDDVIRGVSPPGLTNLWLVLFAVVFLYGALVLAERRSGYVITLLGSLLATYIPILHMSGGGIAKASTPFFVWTDLALCVTGAFSFILAARGLWSLRSGMTG